MGRTYDGNAYPSTDKAAACRIRLPVFLRKVSTPVASTLSERKSAESTCSQTKEDVSVVAANNTSTGSSIKYLTRR